MPVETEFYELLEVEHTADDHTIKRAYKRLALKYHPDRNAGDAEAGEMFKRVGQAYEVLSDADKRKVYDRHGKKGLEEGGGGGGSSADDIFSMFFGGGRRGGGGEPKPKDIVFELAVSLEDVYNGKTKKIAATRNRTCGTCKGEGFAPNAQLTPCTRCRGQGVVLAVREIFPGMAQRVQMRCDVCHGQGQAIRPEDICQDCRGQKVVKDRKVIEIHVEKGVHNKDHVRLTGEGDQVPNIRTLGDIIVFFVVKPHEVFQRVGNHLLFQHEITASEALCGFEFPLEQLDRRLLNIKIPAGQVIDPTHAWVVNREGMPVQNTGGTERGNLVIHFKVKLPDSLDTTMKAAIAKALDYTVQPVDEAGTVKVKLTASLPRPKPETRQQQRAKEQRRRGPQGHGPQGIPVSGCEQQ
eukprot:PhF_6_TR22307/c0_g1_i1/m.31568/K09505/DNAJA4; DnaJ homolog subfamily A member 4